MGNVSRFRVSFATLITWFPASINHWKHSSFGIIHQTDPNTHPAFWNFDIWRGRDGWSSIILLTASTHIIWSTIVLENTLEFGDNASRFPHLRIASTEWVISSQNPMGYMSSRVSHRICLDGGAPRFWTISRTVASTISRSCRVVFVRADTSKCSWKSFPWVLWYSGSSSSRINSFI